MHIHVDLCFVLCVILALSQLTERFHRNSPDGPPTKFRAGIHWVKGTVLGRAHQASVWGQQEATPVTLKTEKIATVSCSICHV